MLQQWPWIPLFWQWPWLTRATISLDTTVAFVLQLVALLTSSPMLCVKKNTIGILVYSKECTFPDLFFHLPFTNLIPAAMSLLIWLGPCPSPTEAEDFSSSVRVQTGSGAHPASCTMGTGDLSPGVNRGRGVMLTTHPHLVLRLRLSRSYTSSHPMRLHGV
jgi:hypothetical protein